MRILIADDHTLFRRGLALLLRQLYPTADLLEATDLLQALALGHVLGDGDLVLLDLAMPGMQGLAGLQRLREAAPAARIVMLSATAETATVRQALAAGARGYIPKTSSDEILRHALSLVQAGELYVPPSVLSDPGRPGGELAALPDDSPLRLLTQRQRDTLALLGEGLSNKEIARRLGLLESTVKAHLKVIMKKLDAGNRTQAALMARELGLGSG